MLKHAYDRPILVHRFNKETRSSASRLLEHNDFISPVQALSKMSYLDEAAEIKNVEEDYVLIPRDSLKNEEPAGYYIVDLRTKEPWMILKTCCLCGNQLVWMKQVLMSLNDSVDRRVAECPVCRSLLRFKPDGTDLTERAEPGEATQQPKEEVPPAGAATPTAGENGPLLEAEAPASQHPAS